MCGWMDLDVWVGGSGCVGGRVYVCECVGMTGWIWVCWSVCGG